MQDEQVDWFLCCLVRLDVIGRAGTGKKKWQAFATRPLVLCGCSKRVPTTDYRKSFDDQKGEMKFMTLRRSVVKKHEPVAVCPSL